jgi:hypothetical protein
MMPRDCAAGRHEIAPETVHNQGFEFGRCRSCGHDMVRSLHHWTRVPKGFRVVWRRRAVRRSDISARQLQLNLPASGRALTLAASPSRPGRKVADALEILLLGLRYAIERAAEKIRAWRRHLRARAAPAPVRCLPAP